MKVVIIDSGLGGLSVCSFLEKALRHACLDSVAIKYVNAVPQDNLGYNQMATRTQKIKIFNRVLSAVANAYQPDFIFVACNTLSVLMEETAFFQQKPTPSIEGMIPLGTSLLFKKLSAQATAAVFIFATETTIEEGVYSHQLQRLGIASHRVVCQALPGVATLISNDVQGAQVYPAILKYTQHALAQIASGWTSSRLPPFEPLYAYLGCTHYGYHQAFFQKAFEESHCPPVILLNPNQEAAQRIFSHILNSSPPSGSAFPVSIEFLSRYTLPSNEVETLFHFLSPYSFATAQALRNYTLRPDLF